MKKKIRDRVIAIANEMKAMPITLADSEKAAEKLTDIIDNKSIQDYDQETVATMFQDGAKAALNIELKMLAETLCTKLVKIRRRYVIVPEGYQLESPAGFHHTDLVFVMPPSIIQTDKLPKPLGAGLGYYDMKIPPFKPKPILAVTDEAA